MCSWQISEEIFFPVTPPWWRLVMMISLYSYHGRKAFQSNVRISFPGKSNQFCNLILFWATGLEFQEKVKKNLHGIQYIGFKICLLWVKDMFPEGMCRLPFLPRDLAMFVTVRTWHEGEQDGFTVFDNYDVRLHIF